MQPVSKARRNQLKYPEARSGRNLQTIPLPAAMYPPTTTSDFQNFRTGRNSPVRFR